MFRAVCEQDPAGKLCGVLGVGWRACCRSSNLYDKFPVECERDALSMLSGVGSITVSALSEC